MNRNSYSEVVRGARKAPHAPKQASPNDDDAARTTSLAWEPSPASPSPPRRPSLPPPPLSSAFPSLDHGVNVESGSIRAHEPLTRMRRSWAAATKGTHSKLFIPSKCTNIKTSSSFSLPHTQSLHELSFFHKTKGPPKSSHASGNNGNITTEAAKEMASPLQDKEVGRSWAPRELPESSNKPLPPSTAQAESQSETWGPNAA